MPAFAQLPQQQSPRLHWAPITRLISPDGSQYAARAGSVLGQTQSLQRRARFFLERAARVVVRSPEDEGDRRRERGDDKAEVDPGPISLGVLGKHEKMDHDPQTDRKSQRKPEEIAGGLVNGRKGRALSAC